MPNTRDGVMRDALLRAFCLAIASGLSWAGDVSAAEVLEFSGPGCLACQRMSPVVAKLKREGYSIRVLDIRRAPRLARQLNIKLLPTFVLVEKGRAIRRIVGATTESRLRELVSSARAPGPESTTRSSVPRRGLDRFARPVQADKADRPDTPVVRAKLEAATSATSSGPMSSCVRLRLEQSDGHEFASGTVIGSRPGRAIILTCGHLFRNFRAEGKSLNTPGSASQLIVDVFDGRRSKAYFARLLGYDLESDVGLVEIAAARVLPVARVSSTATGLSAGQRLLSFGCNGGERPTRSLVTVTQMNRYLGPDNIECTGVPLQGRSGGGLFDAAGRVVGVCFAADPTYQRGLYAGLKPIQDLLVRCRLTSLFKHRDQPGPQRDAVPTVASVTTSGPAGTRSTRVAKTTGVAKPRTVPPRSGPPAVPPRSTSGRSTIAADVAAALASASGAEVICIIRSSANPRAASRVVIINRASRKFVDDLLGEVNAQAQPTTAFRSPRRLTGTSDDRRSSLRGPGHSVRPGIARSPGAARPTGP